MLQAVAADDASMAERGTQATGEKLSTLHHNQAIQAVNVNILDPQQGFSDQSLPPKQEDDGQAQDKRREQGGQCGDSLQKVLTGDVGVGDGIDGKGKPTKVTSIAMITYSSMA